MTMTSTQEARLNKSMKAAQDVSLGTLLADVKDAASVASMNKIEVTVSYSDFADGGGVRGSYTLTEAIPAGATVQICALTSLTGFTGDVSATIQISDGSDDDRYSTGTPSVFTTVAGGIGLGAVSGTAYHATAKTPVILISSSSDWGLVTAGALTLVIYYFA